MNGRWPLILIGISLLAASLVFGLNRRQSNGDVAALKRILGEQICRQVAQADSFKPTKDFPRELIEKSIANLQQERAELGLPPCPRKEPK